MHRLLDACTDASGLRKSVPLRPSECSHGKAMRQSASFFSQQLNRQLQFIQRKAPLFVDTKTGRICTQLLFVDNPGFLRAEPLGRGQRRFLFAIDLSTKKDYSAKSVCFCETKTDSLCVPNFKVYAKRKLAAVRQIRLFRRLSFCAPGNLAFVQKPGSFRKKTTRFAS